MNKLTTIHAEVNTDLYTIFNDSMNQINKPHVRGEMLTGLIKLYLREHQNFEELKEMIQDINLHLPHQTTLNVNNINPKVHKKFIKHLEKKYNTKNITKYYNTTINNLLIIHAYGILKLESNQIKPEEAEIYGIL